MRLSLSYDDLTEEDKKSFDEQTAGITDEGYRYSLVEIIFGFEYYCRRLDSGDLEPLVRHVRTILSNSSKMERLIYNILNKKLGIESIYYDVRFDYEFGSSGICYLDKQRFDFFIPSNTIIEYDGEQHFRDIKMFNATSFEYRVASDNAKNDWCRRMGAKLLRIPYIFSDENKLESILSNFIENDVVDSDIIDFYRGTGFSNYCSI